LRVVVARVARKIAAQDLKGDAAADAHQVVALEVLADTALENLAQHAGRLGEDAINGGHVAARVPQGGSVAAVAVNKIPYGHFSGHGGRFGVRVRDDPLLLRRVPTWGDSRMLPVSNFTSNLTPTAAPWTTHVSQRWRRPPITTRYSSGGGRLSAYPGVFVTEYTPPLRKFSYSLFVKGVFATKR